jgi:hypothetical protein
VRSQNKRSAWKWVSLRLIQLVEKELPKARIVKRGGRKYLTHERTVTLADTQRACFGKITNIIRRLNHVATGNHWSFVQSRN